MKKILAYLFLLTLGTMLFTAGCGSNIKTGGCTTDAATQAVVCRTDAGQQNICPANTQYTACADTLVKQNNCANLTFTDTNYFEMSC